MKKWEFEKKLKAKYGDVQISTIPVPEGETIKYNYGIEHENIFITDLGKNGIEIKFFDQAGQQQVIGNFYHWSDAYQVMFWVLTEPERLDEWEGVDGGELSGTKPYNFKWDPAGTILDFEDYFLEYALELVKYGFVKALDYDQGRDEIIITGCLAACRENCSPASGRDALLKALRDENNGINEADTAVRKSLNISVANTLFGKCNMETPSCPDFFCVFPICGYLEYVIANGTLSALLEKREKIQTEMKTPCGPYSFTWMPADGLRKVPENRFQLALQMAHTRIVLVDQTLHRGSKVRIYMYQWITDTEFLPEGENECTSCSMATVADMQKGWPTSQQENWIEIGASSTLHSWVEETSEDFCVYYYAGYIQYLEECGLEDRILEDREWFQKNIRGLDREIKMEFHFQLPTDWFMDESEDLFELSELLQEHNYVSLCLEPREDAYHIVTVQAVLEMDVFGNFAQLKQEVLEDKVDRLAYMSFLIEKAARWDEMVAETRHVALAAYIDYLRRTGQYEDYKEKRKAYRRNIATQFEDVKSENPGLEKVIAIANNEKDSSLYCILEGEQGAGQEEIVSQIAKVLMHTGKVDTAEPKELTFESLAAWVGYSMFHEDRYATAEDAFMVYENMKQKELIVLTGLEEFLYKCQGATLGDGSRETHLIELLGHYQPQTFIIVRGERKYVEQFLALSPQITFLFRDNVIQIENLSSEKLYNVYVQKLSKDIKDKLAGDDGFKDQFLDFIALNGKFMPLENRELAEYLADYANTKKELILPPDVYRRQSAKELLESVIGMENVKKAAYEFEKYAFFLKRAEISGMDLPDSNMHMLFTGGPGTGKTMIARIIGQMLYDMDIIEEPQIKEVEPRNLVSQYVGESAAKMGKVIEEAIGGVLFIDEAYALGDTGVSDEVIAALVKAMEDHKKDLVVIFAGYEKEMHAFLNTNPGLASRIGYTFHFNDYSVDELVEMFAMKIKKAGFEYQKEEILPLVREICANFIEKKDFGNGRFVDRIVRNVILAHAQRTTSNEDIRVLIPEDIPTVQEMVSTDVMISGAYEEQLEAFIGMDGVKRKVRQFANYVEFQQKAKKTGANIPAGNMHMIFSGNPGTGKTTIARIMADMLFSIGIIKTNKMIEVERKDLVAEYVGQTAGKTTEVIERAMDGILFIDEAYTLTPTSSGDFGSEAIATLIKAMEDHKNNLIVIFAGYQDEMRNFTNANPGISSRIGYVFDFEDYSPDELTKMYQKKMNESGFKIDSDALKKATVIFEYFSKKKSFGNGRFVNKLLQETLMKHSSRLAESKESNENNLLIIRQDDIPEIVDLVDTVKKPEAINKLDSIIGMHAVKEKLKEFESFVNFGIIANERGLSIPDFNMHMIFSGNPGTGKTTIARIIGDKLYSIGVIKENRLVEVERKDLVAGYVGQTAEKVGGVIEKAMGGILFIDEAYTLTPKSEQDFGSEAIATLIKAMEDYKDNLIVIFAGYKKEMAEFIDSNPGIASRIGFTFDFEDYSPDELKDIYMKKMQANGFTVKDNAHEKLLELMNGFVEVENFGNGRFVDRVIQKSLMKHAEHYDEKEVEIIGEDDIPTVEEMRETMGTANVG